MTGPGFNNMDANLYKLTPLWRNLVFDFEAQFFNIYNHQNLGLPNNNGVILYTAGGQAVNGSIPTNDSVAGEVHLLNLLHAILSRPVIFAGRFFCDEFSIGVADGVRHQSPSWCNG